MEVKQIYTLLNSVSNEVLGRTDIIQEDLTGIVDMGTEVFNANAIDNFVKSLVNHIGKVVFVNRPYMGKVPSVLMDSWEFGSVLEKYLPTSLRLRKTSLGNSLTALNIVKTCFINQRFLQSSLIAV